MSSDGWVNACLLINELTHRQTWCGSFSALLQSSRSMCAVIFILATTILGNNSAKRFVRGISAVTNHGSVSVGRILTLSVLTEQTL